MFSIPNRGGNTEKEDSISMCSCLCSLYIPVKHCKSVTVKIPPCPCGQMSSLTPEKQHRPPRWISSQPQSLLQKTQLDPRCGTYESPPPLHTHSKGLQSGILLSCYCLGILNYIFASRPEFHFPLGLTVSIDTPSPDLSVASMGASSWVREAIWRQGLCNYCLPPGQVRLCPAWLWTFLGQSRNLWTLSLLATEPLPGDQPVSPLTAFLTPLLGLALASRETPASREEHQSP